MRTILPKNTLVVIAALFTLMFALPQKAMAQSKEAYAVRDNAGTITFYYDDQKATRTGTIANIKDGYYATQAWIGSPKYNPTGITTAVFDASFAGYAPTSLNEWFRGMSALTTVKGMEYLNTANVETMKSMFAYCSALQTVDMSHCNTDKLSNIVAMFKDCSVLQTVDLTNFGTALYDMREVFLNCTELTTIYCNNTWPTDNVISGSIFGGCWKLKGAVAFDPGKTSVAMANPKTGYFTKKTVTGIDTPTVNVSQKKQGTYNLAGQRVGDSYKGIVIENGRKVVRK